MVVPRLFVDLYILSDFLKSQTNGEDFIIFEAEYTYREYSGKSAVTSQDSHTRFQHGEDQQLQNLQQKNIFLVKEDIYIELEWQ